MAQTDNTQQTGALPVVPSGNDLFNTIMQKIEPELTTSLFPTMQEKYKNETPEQKAAREARYQKAFAEFEKQFDAYVIDMQTRIHAFQRGVLEAMEDADRATDDNSLENLESLLAA